MIRTLTDHEYAQLLGQRVKGLRSLRKEYEDAKAAEMAAEEVRTAATMRRKDLWTKVNAAGQLLRALCWGDEAMAVEFEE